MEPKARNSVVELCGVNKIYQNGVPTHVLHDINLTITPGEFVVIRGQSGSGKSTLLNLIGLLDTPTSGEIFAANKPVSSLSESERARVRREYIGFIFQFHYLLPEFNVIDNALMPCRIIGKKTELKNKARVLELLEEVGLGHRLTHRPRALSGGEQQRVAVVRALANNPALVLADEPTGNLDTKTSRTVFDLLRSLNRESGTAFLIVTHDESLIREADQIIDLVDGRISEQ